MKIEISDLAIANDKQGSILSFIKFAEQVFEACPVNVDESDPTNWLVYMDASRFLASMKFPKNLYTKDKSVEIFNSLVYGKPAPDSEITDLRTESSNDS